MYNLYNTLFNENQNANTDTPDVALDIINQMHNDYENISKYHDITACNKLISQISDKVNIMHMNSP